MEFGETIKQIRKSQGLSQTVLAKGIMSRSNLSRFEQGDYYPSYDKIISIIAKLGLSLEEILYIANDYQANPLQQLERRLVEYENQFNLKGLKEVSRLSKAGYQDTGNWDYQMLYLFTQLSCLNLGEPDECLDKGVIKETILPYFESKEEWYIKDLRFLNNALAIFDLADACFLANRALKSFEKYQNFQVQTNLQTNLLINLGSRCFEAGMLDESRQYFQRGKEYANSFNHVYNQLICASYLAIIAGDKAEQLESYLSVLELLGYQETANHLNLCNSGARDQHQKE